MTKTKKQNKAQKLNTSTQVVNHNRITQQNSSKASSKADEQSKHVKLTDNICTFTTDPQRPVFTLRTV